MPFGIFRCPECRTPGRVRGGRRFIPPDRNTFNGTPAPVFEQERVCLNCGAWLWVAAQGWHVHVTPAAPRLLALSAAAELDVHVDAVLAGVAATEAFKRELTAHMPRRST
jgi:hypothetical protein